MEITGITLLGAYAMGMTKGSTDSLAAMFVVKELLSKQPSDTLISLLNELGESAGKSLGKDLPTL